MPDTQPQLAALRGGLEEVDQEIVRQLARRLALVADIGAAKSATGEAVRDAARERDVLAAVERSAREFGISVQLVRRIFGEIVKDAVARQSTPSAASGHAVRVSYQGVANAYSHLAVTKYAETAGVTAVPIGYRSFHDAVAALTSGAVDLSVLPIENTTAGSINQVYELLRTEDVHVVGEETWQVDHCLAGPADVPITSIRRVLSHPQGLEQCSVLLQTLPDCEAVSYFDTADALRAVAEAGDPTQAAIGSPEAAAEHGLVVLRHGIANQEENHTRFVVLGREPRAVDPRVPGKTSLVLITRHEPGALLRCLEVLAGEGLSLTKIESRPRPGRPWEYLFFLDLAGTIDDPATAAALDELRVTALFVKVLGSYPAKAMPGEAQPTAPDPVAGAAPAARTRPRRALAERAGRPTDSIIRVGDVLVGGDGFTVMAGPCSVESVEQIESTARHVRAHGAAVLRGGVFKPRTSPYSFQGLGYEGLELLVAAGRVAGLPVVTEVMAPDQVRPVAEQVDILQVGARNMQNFTLLRELGKVDRPVLLKRGLSSTIDEWLAAAEYILSQGNQQVILCERGIRTFESATRNTLDLSAVVVLRERTHLPILVDPSHGTGRRSYVTPMAWAAQAAGAHGLLIEVHPQPGEALSDGDQSLDFDGFATLMAGLAAVHGT